MSDSSSAAGIKRLRWRCRRGMKELDLLLVAWLDARYDTASSDERAAFEALLDLPDPELAGYLLAHERPSDPVLARVVAQAARRPH